MSQRSLSEDYEFEDDTEEYQSSFEDSELGEDMSELMETVKTNITTFKNADGEIFIMQNNIYEDIMAKL